MKNYRGSKKFKVNLPTTLDVFLGVPGSTNKPRKDEDGNREDITNAYLMMIHEKGYPGHYPARPVFPPVIKSSHKQISRAFAYYFHTGDERYLEELALYLEGKSKEYIQDKNNLAPNAPSTIRRKSVKNKQGKIIKLSDTPLIDTGQLIGSIKCWVEEGEEKNGK